MFYMVYRSYSVLNSTVQDTQILRRSEFFNGILSEMRKNINMKQVLSKKNYQSTKLKHVAADSFANLMSRGVMRSEGSVCVKIMYRYTTGVKIIYYEHLKECKTEITKLCLSTPQG